MEQILKLSKDEIVTIFNDEMSTFLSELLKIFSQLESNKETVNKLLSYKSLIETGIAANKVVGIEMFGGYIFKKGNEDFCEKITSKNFNFFINLEVDKSNKLAEILMLIKDLFIKLSDTNRNNIFGYLENLSTLANIYTMKKLV
jgi:hypothetical protein